MPLTQEATERHDVAATLHRMGIDYGELEANMRAKDPKFGPRDIYGAALNQKLLDALRRADWGAVSRIFETQVDELVERGKPYLAVAREASKAELRKLQKAHVTDVRIIAYTSHARPCSACVADGDRVVSIEAEIVSPSVPHEACVDAAMGPCGCRYSAIV